jgi:hypothetical protein
MVFEPKKFFGEALGSLGEKVGGFLGIGGGPTMGPQAASSGSTNNVNIQIDGSKDPKAVGKEVIDKLKKATGDSFFQQPQAGY